MISINKTLSILICFFLISCASNKSKEGKKVEVELPPKADIVSIKTNIYNGFVKKIEFKLGENYKEIQLKCRGKETGFDKSETGLRFFISAPYKYKTDTFKCLLSTNEFGWTPIVDVKIKPYKYRQEFLKVPKKHVDLAQKDIDQWLKDKKALNEVYSNAILDRALFSKPFRKPLNSKITSSYGKRRVFNDKKDSWHSGIDFRARRPTKIPSSNRGKVVFSGHLFFNGNTIIVDHGLGIFTMYCHLSKLKAEVGEIIPKGAIVGLSGNTGRSSAPHLHWGVKVGGNWINGFSLLKQGI
ncbi:MAG: M23 family metallopeptidase [Bacteriovoracaceae bacterium]|nr:M23 family metallopeptidase [Bacteriovoracaceae bacterium]